MRNQGTGNSSGRKKRIKGNRMRRISGTLVFRVQLLFGFPARSKSEEGEVVQVEKSASRTIACGTRQNIGVSASEEFRHPICDCVQRSGTFAARD